MGCKALVSSCKGSLCGCGGQWGAAMQSGPFEGKEGVGETEPLVVVSRHDIRTGREKRRGDGEKDH